MKSKHLGEVEMSYFKHVRRALRFSYYCFYCGIRTLIHAFIPDVFTDTSIEMDCYLEEFIYDDED
jgi:hypothetical protein